MTEHLSLREISRQCDLSLRQATLKRERREQRSARRKLLIGALAFIATLAIAIFIYPPPTIF